MRWVGVILFAIFVTTIVHAKHKMPERTYQEKHCAGVMEVTLSDRTRVDCLTDEYAIEFDFAPKWAQALGQSLHYALRTARAPAVYLILESKKDKRFVDRLAPLCDIYGVKLVLIENY